MGREDLSRRRVSMCSLCRSEREKTVLLLCPCSLLISLRPRGVFRREAMLQSITIKADLRNSYQVLWVSSSVRNNIGLRAVHEVSAYRIQPRCFGSGEHTADRECGHQYPSMPLHIVHCDINVNAYCDSSPSPASFSQTSASSSSEPLAFPP